MMNKVADTQTALPENRLIRRRVAARTTAIHVSALASEVWAKDIVAQCDPAGYVQKSQFPDAIEVEPEPGESLIISRDEAWRLADAKGAQMEWALLSGLSGRVAAYFSKHGQGIYADYGRPTFDFSGFFRDRIAGVGRGDLRLGPLFIAWDTATAAGLTALGHFARRADLTSAPIVSDVLSTGVYEGSSSWASAKLGVIAGVKAIGVAALVPVPGAAFVAGFTVGAATAIVAKTGANKLKDRAVDAVYHAADQREDQAPMVVSA